MDSIVASQWIDFTENISPQIPMKDYFDKEHAIHGRIVEFGDLPMEDSESISTDLCVNKEAQQDLDIIKSTPVKVISPKYRKKTTMTEQITYDQVLTDAIKKLELCKKPLKTRGTLNKTIQEPNTFKTPNMSIKKSSRSVGYRNVSNNLDQFNTTRRSVRSDKDTCVLEKSDNIIIYETKTLSNYSLLKQDQADIKGDISKKTVQVDHYENEKEDTKEYIKEHEEQNKEENKETLHDETEELINNENKQEQNNMDAIIEKDIRNNKLRASVLTWQSGRRNLNKRRSSNRFVSLAEAVSRFQNDTPKRFRTRCNKNHVEALQNVSSKSSIQHHRLKPTIPISPALMSKNRTRAITVLSQEEREKREMEEMKKHPIKANPIPLSVLRGPVCSVPKTIMKKWTIPATVAGNFSSATVMQQSEKTFTNTSALLKNPGKSHHDKTLLKNTVTKVLVTDPTGIIVEREEIPYFGVPKDNSTARSVTRVVPFSFEARNKDLKIKKEQRLKSLQEANKAKMEFHAKPAPNFSKSLLTTPPPVVKQQKEKKKTTIQQCPFSFEKRDKNLSKKKEELVKQVLEENKRMRVFRAKPVPVFKPVKVRGVFKEHVSVKEEYVVDKRDDQENKEPNIISIETTQENKYMRKTKVSCAVVDKQNELELNTDKRARERREFDERIKRKEIEEEVKRQEDKRRQEENEKQMRAEQRKLAEVKARPMPKYKSLIITKATKPLTEPQSPMLSNKYKRK